MSAMIDNEEGTMLGSDGKANIDTDKLLQKLKNKEEHEKRENRFGLHIDMKNRNSIRTRR